MPPENISNLATGTTQSLIWITAFFLCIPFLAGIVKNIQMIFKSLLKKSLDKHTQNELLKNKAFSVIHTILITIAIFIFSGVFLSISAPYMPEGIPLMIFGIAAAVLAGAIVWSMIHSVFIRPFVLTGVLRNYIESGMNDVPTEASFGAVATKSAKFRKLQAEL